MAINVHLQIDDIKGESADEGQKQWIERVTATWSVRQPRSATASTDGGHTIERSEHGEVAISKLSDISFPLLLQNCSTGRTIPSARMDFMRAGENGDRIKYFEILLENVLIGDVCPTLHERKLLSEHVGLKLS